MKNKSFYSRVVRVQPISPNTARLVAGLLFFVVWSVLPSRAGNAPQWMHNLTDVPLPAHDEKTDAVLLYSEKNVDVISTDKIKITVRRAYKILRPGGRDYGTALVTFRSPGEKVNGLRGWCVPAQGKDYEVKDKEAIEGALPKVDGSELINDVRAKFLTIPAADPGNIVGYEYELEENPLVLQDQWVFQREIPSRESHYSIQLPSGWEFKAAFLNYPELKPAQSSSNQAQWTVTDIKAIRREEDMPPVSGLESKMIVYLFPPGGPGTKGYANWQEMGAWYNVLTTGRRDASPEIRAKVAQMTFSAPTPLAKMQTIAAFMQHDIRYVGIELGIGGYQPHTASEIFVHHYGDCKDKATLMSAMLHEIGIDSYYVVINAERGTVAPDMPAHNGFNHVILAIALPRDNNEATLGAVMNHAKLGKLLFFDPTDRLTPFGQISGGLQANYGLLVTPSGGELVEVPKQPAAMNSIRRSGKLSLDSFGNLHGDIEEVRLGDRARGERWALRNVNNDKDRIKPIESLLAGSLSNFRITKATVTNLTNSDQPFGFDYSFDAASYAKNAGGLLLIRPRVIGVKAQGILETKEPRQFPVEFEAPLLDTDVFEISLPNGYTVDDLPPAVDADYGFASYHSKTELKGNSLVYTRSYEVKELSVPVSRAQELKKFYRVIATDERNTAILKPAH